MYYDILFHIDFPDLQRLDIALSNIRHYLAALSNEKFSIVLVANSSAVQLFTREQIDYVDDMRLLADKGVSFRICANAMRKIGLIEGDLLPFCTITPAGIVEIVQLQQEGFSYVKP